MALLSNLSKVQFRARICCRIVQYFSSLCLLLLLIRALVVVRGNTHRRIIARRQDEHSENQRTAVHTTKSDLLHEASPHCSRGHFSLPSRSECRPWLNCTEISRQIRREKLIGGFRKQHYLADWKGHRVVYSKCAWTYREFLESCRHGIKMMELLQSEFVTRLIGVCHETLEMVTEYHKHGPLSNVLPWQTEWLTQYENIETRLQLSVDYVKIINYLHHSPIGMRVMCDTHTLFKTMSQFLITDDFHLVVNDLDNLPRVSHADGKLIKCTRSREIRTRFVAPEQKWPNAARPFNETLMLPYDEKTDIWKIPVVINNLLGNVKGSSLAKSRLRHVMDSCRRIDPRERPGASEVLQAFLKVQDLMKEQIRQQEFAAA